MQEEFYWLKVQKMWDYYVRKQEFNLTPEEWKIRKEDGFYPAEMPSWWRECHSHSDMWKYGIWPQHSLIAHDRVFHHQKKFIHFKSSDFYKEGSKGSQGIVT